MDTENKFQNVLIAQLGKLGQIVMDLEAVATVHPDKAKELAQTLDDATETNDTETFNRVVQQIEQLAREVRHDD